MSLPFKPSEHESSETDSKDREDEYDVDISVSLVVVLWSMCLPFWSVERSMWLVFYSLKVEFSWNESFAIISYCLQLFRDIPVHGVQSLKVFPWCHCCDWGCVNLLQRLPLLLDIWWKIHLVIHVLHVIPNQIDLPGKARKEDKLNLCNWDVKSFIWRG